MVRRIGFAVALVALASAGAVLMALEGSAQQAPVPSAQAVREAARQAGLAALSTVRVPRPPNLDEFFQPGQERLALQLGKALFWDVQVGSDGQACGSCHFHAGADNRVKNQVNPGLKGNDKTFGGMVTEAGKARGLTAAPFGPNYSLQAGDFPLRLLADGEEADHRKRVVLRDSNDKVSSQGVVKWHFDGVDVANVRDLGTPEADDVFQVGGANLRRVEPRHTPTTINAAFNHEQFWDGRAQNFFNGINPFGGLDRNAKILAVENGAIVERRILIPNASLASQAVGPPLSPDEMSYAARGFPDIGKKLMGARPLALQRVHPEDSLLGPLVRASQDGLTTPSYGDMIRAVFLPAYWQGEAVVTFDGDKRVLGGTPAAGLTRYSLIEANFALFFGLAIQVYEATLISDQTPFDRFMEGDDAALDAEQQRGLLAFINKGTDEQKANPVFAGVKQANCVACHLGAELTAASASFMGRGIALADQPAAMVDGRVTAGVGNGALLLDRGFSNIGVRPTAEDIGHGDTVFGIPFSRQPLARLDLPANAFEQLVEGQMAPPQLGIKGAFKTPGLRNVELTGPYFHNGGQATLDQVLDFYVRFGDFADVNIKELDVSLARVEFDGPTKNAIGRLLLALTDERVRNDAAPFDHPQLFIPDGHPGNHVAVTCGAMAGVCADEMREVPAVGAGGRSALGLPVLGTFLDLPPLGPPGRQPPPPR